MPTIYKTALPILLLFIFINSIVAGFKEQLALQNFNTKVIFIGNGILFIMSIASIAMHINAKKSKNTNAGINSVMIGFIIKFFVVAITSFTYIKLSGASVNKKGILLVMALYIVYSFIETSIALKLTKNNGNK